MLCRIPFCQGYLSQRAQKCARCVQNARRESTRSVDRKLNLLKQKQENFHKKQKQVWNKGSIFSEARECTVFIVTNRPICEFVSKINVAFVTNQCMWLWYTNCLHVNAIPSYHKISFSKSISLMKFCRELTFVAYAGTFLLSVYHILCSISYLDFIEQFSRCKNVRCLALFVMNNFQRLWQNWTFNILSDGYSYTTVYLGRSQHSSSMRQHATLELM